MSPNPATARTGTTPAASRVAVTALVALIISIIPSFMVGGVAVLVREDLGFSESRLGIAISMFYATSALAAVAGGRLSERLGGIPALRVGVVVSTISLLGIAALTRSWGHLLVWLAIAGLGNAVLQPATNLAIARAIPLGRQGLALGFKQTNGPLGTLIAGLAAPLIAVPFGWRWAFVAAAAISLPFWIICPVGVQRTVSTGAKVRTDATSKRALRLLATGCGLGVATSMALVGFYMESAVSLGHSIGFAGLCLAIGSGAGAFARVGWGWVADRFEMTGVSLITGMLTVGSLAFAGLAYSSAPVVLLLVTIAVFVTGWGWPGMMHLTTIRLYPEAPAHASGVVNAGVSLGGIAGPFAFGFAVEQVGYGPGWWAVGVTALAAAGFVLAAGKLAARREEHDLGTDSEETP
jgi:MFS family permease